ncbi:MAG: beta-N-acetylhexosaminidase [Alphaproteobacteria bacterium]
MDNPPATRAFVVGLSGLELTSDEADFLSKWRPWGVILFGRNVATPLQVRLLAIDVRRALGAPEAPEAPESPEAPAAPKAPILIDQEGGRVQRLKPPGWRTYPPAARLGAIYTHDHDAGRRATWLHARLIAHDLFSLGINFNCLPVLDVGDPDTHAVIAERSYGADPTIVAELGRVAAQGLADGGVQGVMKHIPGHGRTRVDSHHHLPVVSEDMAALRAHDFAPFKALAHLPVAMTAHILFKTLDTQAPATFSPAIIDQVIRNEIGFKGLLLSDDLSMNALAGTIDERAARALGAGCDIALHCNGKLDQMIAVAKVIPVLSGASLARAHAVAATMRAPSPFDVAAGADEFDRLLGGDHG